MSWTFLTLILPSVCGIEIIHPILQDTLFNTKNSTLMPSVSDQEKLAELLPFLAKSDLSGVVQVEFKKGKYLGRFVHFKGLY